MGWFHDPSSAPTIHTRRGQYKSTFSVTTDTSLIGYDRTQVVDEYETRGLSETTATGYADTLNMQDSVSASAERVSPGGGWNVRYSILSDTWMPI